MNNYDKLRRYRGIALALAFILMPFVMYAQDMITVSGVVSDDTQQPVIGASVMIKGSTTGVPTDLDGNYSITVPDNAVLEFSSVGLKTVEIPVNGRTAINVVLPTDNTFLESVVVVGYGTQKKGSITGSVAGVGNGDIIKTKSENPQNMLTGRVPGLRVWQKTAEPGTYNNAFDIRGMGTPLVIIDGVPRDMADFQRLNATDIENVSVLKDAAAAIYGVRAGNGVVLVTTKKGSEGKAKVSYNGSFTFQTPSKMPELTSAVDAMTEKSIALVFSFPRYPVETQKMAEEIQKRNVTSFAITDSKFSPILKCCSYYLLTPQRYLIFVDPVSSAMTMLHALLVSVYQKNEDDIKRRLAKYEKSILSADMFIYKDYNFAQKL